MSDEARGAWVEGCRRVPASAPVRAGRDSRSAVSGHFGKMFRNPCRGDAGISVTPMRGLLREVQSGRRSVIRLPGGKVWWRTGPASGRGRGPRLGPRKPAPFKKSPPSPPKPPAAARPGSGCPRGPSRTSSAAPTSGPSGRGRFLARSRAGGLGPRRSNVIVLDPPKKQAADPHQGEQRGERALLRQVLTGCRPGDGAQAGGDELAKHSDAISYEFFTRRAIRQAEARPTRNPRKIRSRCLAHDLIRGSGPRRRGPGMWCPGS